MVKSGFLSYADIKRLALWVKFSADNLHEMSNPVLWENEKNIMNLLSAEIYKRVIKVKA